MFGCSFTEEISHGLPGRPAWHPGGLFSRRTVKSVRPSRLVALTEAFAWTTIAFTILVDPRWIRRDRLMHPCLPP